ncbi:unnamed protein product [Meganyctiphanes norvegica]|uniref:Uncharacterized protein n=1 Tax=Meganyctiphanes norvegica TaxID=48144 RepID=A0AAV2PVM8_MEGNR
MEVLSEAPISLETVTRSTVTSMESSSFSSSYSSNIQIESVSNSSIIEPEPMATLESEPVDENANAIEAPIADTTAEISQENIKTQLQEIISEIEQNVEPEDEEDVTPEQEDAVKSLVEQELKLMQEEEALLSQQPREEEESQPYCHTWKPKGKYDIVKTEVKHEDINAVKVDDPQLTEVPKPVVAVPQEKVVDEQASVTKQVDMQPNANGFIDEIDGLPPGFDIPASIPLLARILPKNPSETTEDRKISLERLFTPATDSPNLTPTRNKKVFASSDFYRADHPTIEDQVDLAHRISQQLINDDNKQSRGHSMYVKRQERSEKWTNEEGYQEIIEYSGVSQQSSIQQTVVKERPNSMPIMPTLQPVKKDSTPSMPVSVPVQEMPTLRPVKERSPMKLTTNPNQGHVEPSEFESPTGRGAALFAKRKKRMEKYIVDETTVQQSKEAGGFAHQQTSVMSASSMESSSSLVQNQLELQPPIMFGGVQAAAPTSLTNGTQGVLAAAGDVIYAAECKVVTRSHSHPPTPQFELPSSGPLMDLTTNDKREKRKSFNFAAKGFGTYQDFYTPIHLGKAC